MKENGSGCFFSEHSVVIATFCPTQPNYHISLYLVVYMQYSGKVLEML